MGLKIQSLTDDRARCMGEHWLGKDTCLRHAQIEQDPVRVSNRYLTYVRSLRSVEGHCDMRIEIDRDLA